MKTTILALAATALVLLGCENESLEQQMTSAGNTELVKVVIDIPRIALKSKEEVVAVIGAPLECEETKHGEKCSFAPGETEIVFIDGKADWITVSDMAAMPYSENSLAAIGLTVMPPSVLTTEPLAWNSIDGLRAVSFFPSGKSIWYAYIRAKTE